MKQISLLITFCVATISWSQNSSKATQKLNKQAKTFIAKANTIVSNNFVEAEMGYRKAISANPTTVAGTYNLAHSYYKKENYEEALFRNQQAATNATDKSEKHKAFHNIGNILMKEKKCKEAVEAFKNALRNNPKDNETRYNLALAQECAKGQQDDKPQDEDKDGDNKSDEQDNKDDQNKDSKGNNEDDNKNDKGENEAPKDDKEQDKKEQENKENKKDKGDKGDEKQQQPQQQKGQLSPQQIKNLLEAMNNEEQKVQEKVNAKKAKGVKVPTEKDW